MGRHIKRLWRRTFLKEWREHAGLNQMQLAERIGWSQATISTLEAGKAPYTQETLEALAEALGCEPVDLLIRNPQDPDGVWKAIKVLTRKAS